MFKGEVVIGPAPDTLRYDDDEDEGRDNATSSKASKTRNADVKKGSQASTSGLDRFQPNTSELERVGRQSGDGLEARRVGTASTPERDLVRDRSKGGGPASGGVSPAVSDRRKAENSQASSSSPRSKKREPVAHHESDDDDDDDDGDELDVAQLEKQLQRAKASAGGKAAIAANPKGKLSSSVKSELQRELEALHGEKASARAERWTARKEESKPFSKER